MMPFKAMIGKPGPTGLATWRLLGSTINNSAGTKTVTATPNVGELIVIASFNTNSAYDTPTDNQGGTYTSVIDSVSFNGGTGTSRNNRFHVGNQLITSAVSTIFSATPFLTSQGGIAVFGITGMTKIGTAAVKQATHSLDNEGPSTPVVTFVDTPLSGNTILVTLGVMVNPAAMTPPSGFTEDLDTGWATGPTGAEAAHFNNYTGGSTITWGSGATGTGWGAIIVEFDTSP